MSTPNTPPQTPTSYLLLENQGQFLRVFITKPRIFLGHAEDNDIVIRDAQVLPRHAEIFASGNRYNLVTVAGGQSQINGRGAEGVHTLVNGDHLMIGGTQVLYVEEQRQSDVALHLIVRRKEELPFGVTITKPMVRIGRMKGDVLIEDDNLSPTHTIIENFCADAIFVMDAKSKSGTWLNDAKLTGRRRLRSGDTLSLGSTQISVLYSQSNVAQATTPVATPPTAPAQPVAPPAAQAPPEPLRQPLRHERAFISPTTENGYAKSDPESALGGRSRTAVERSPNIAISRAGHQDAAIGAHRTPSYDEEAIPLPDRPPTQDGSDRNRHHGSGLTQAIPIGFERPKTTRPESPLSAEPISDGRTGPRISGDSERPPRQEQDYRDSAPPRPRPRTAIPSSRYDERYHYLPPEEEEWASHSESPPPRVSEHKANFDSHSENRRGLTQGIPANVVLRKRPNVATESDAPPAHGDMSGQYYHPDDKPRRK